MADDRITELTDAMQQLDELLVRFEIDTASRVHVVDYHASMPRLCDEFARQMHELLEDDAACSGNGENSLARVQEKKR